MWKNFKIKLSCLEFEGSECSKKMSSRTTWVYIDGLNITIKKENFVLYFAKSVNQRKNLHQE